MRANCRFERFAQTINITTPTAHASTSNAGRTRPLIRRSSGVSLGTIGFRSGGGCWISICFASKVNSGRAFSTLAPGFNRPMIVIALPRRFVSSVSGQGMKISTGFPGANSAAKSKDAGNTPATVTARLLNINLLPTTAGSEAKRRCQKP